MFETRNDPQPDPREGPAGAGLPPPVAALKAAGAKLAEVDYHRLEAAALTSGSVRDSGAANTTQWLVETGGGSARKARRIAGRASRLRELPDTARALSEGEVTPVSTWM